MLFALNYYASIWAILEAKYGTIHHIVVILFSDDNFSLIFISIDASNALDDSNCHYVFYRLGFARFDGKFVLTLQQLLLMLVVVIVFTVLRSVKGPSWFVQRRLLLYRIVILKILVLSRCLRLLSESRLFILEGLALPAIVALSQKRSMIVDYMSILFLLVVVSIL